MAIGAKLKQIIDEKGIKPSELAAMTNLSAQTIYSLISRDSNKVSIDALINICNALDISVEELYQYDLNEKQNITSLKIQYSVYPHEKDVIEAYRQKPEAVQAMVDKMLDVAPVNTNQPFARVAAFGGGTKDVPPPKVSEEEIERLVEEAEQEEMLAEIEAEKRRKGK